MHNPARTVGISCTPSFLIDLRSSFTTFRKMGCRPAGSVPDSFPRGSEDHNPEFERERERGISEERTGGSVRGKGKAKRLKDKVREMNDGTVFYLYLWQKLRLSRSSVI